jgi:hypothetical protein
VFSASHALGVGQSAIATTTSLRRQRCPGSPHGPTPAPHVGRPGSGTGACRVRRFRLLLPSLWTRVCCLGYLSAQLSCSLCLHAQSVHNLKRSGGCFSGSEAATTTRARFRPRALLTYPPRSAKRDSHAFILIWARNFQCEKTNKKRYQIGFLKSHKYLETCCRVIMDV